MLHLKILVFLFTISNAHRVIEKGWWRIARDFSDPDSQYVTFHWDYPYSEWDLYSNVSIEYYCVLNVQLCQGASLSGYSVGHFNTSVGPLNLVCTISCANGTWHSVKKTLHVKSIEKLTPRLSIISNILDHPNVTVGDTLEFLCECFGKFDIEIHWDCKDRIRERANISGENGGRFTLKNITHSDKGYYACECTNHIEYVKVSRIIRIADKQPIQHLFPGQEDVIISSFILILTAVIVLASCVCACVLYLKLKKHHEETEYLVKQLGTLEKYLNEPDMNEMCDAEDGFLIVPSRAKYDTKWEIDIEKVKIGKLIGEGFFADIFEGKMGLRNVAVKTLKNSLNIDHVKSLLSELKIMSNLGDHPNIVDLIGACTSRLKRGELYVVVELCELGNLKDYLIKARQNFGSTDCPIDRKCLIRFCLQICCGMEFLSSKNILHRDLAARNVLLTAHKTIKLCDFGLARNLYDGYRYNLKSAIELPLKWMAIESMVYNTYTTKSDVWSFGVCCWEIFTLGVEPYLGLDGADFKAMVVSGHRLDKPARSPGSAFSMMKKCWYTDPNERPSFGQLVKHFHTFINEQDAGSVSKDQPLSVPTPKLSGYVPVMRATGD